MHNTSPDTTEQASLPTILSDERAQAVIEDLKKAVGAAFDLLAEYSRSRTDADDWHRLPVLVRKGNNSDPDTRCPVSHYGRSKVIRLIEADLIRDKHVGRNRYYSLADMRSYIRNQSAKN